MPNFNFFGDDNEDTSFEQGSPINQAAKNVVQGAASQVKKAASQVGDDFRDQLLQGLYGPSTPQDQGTDESNSSQSDHNNAHIMTQMGANNGSSANSNQSPQEQQELAKVRSELFAKNHGGQFNIERQIDMERKKREQREQQRKQEEEEERQRKEAEKAQMQEAGALMPAGKKTGAMMGKKQQAPMAIRLEQTKSESNRGTSG